MVSGSSTPAAASAGPTTTGPNTTGRITKELIAAFRRDGFVVVPELLGAAEVAGFAPAVTRAVAARRNGDDRDDWRDDSSGERRGDDDVTRNLWECDVHVRPLSLHPVIAAAAAALIGADAVRVWTDRVTFDEPGAGDVHLHRDHGAWPIAEARTIVAWLPLDPLDEADAAPVHVPDGPRAVGPLGGRGYVPGSHRSGLRQLVSARCVDPDALIGGVDDDDPVDPVVVRVPPGSVAFHHGLTGHLMGPNPGLRVRRALSITYFADGCTRGPGDPHDSVDRTGIELGAPIDGPVTPIAWPTPAPIER